MKSSYISEHCWWTLSAFWYSGSQQTWGPETSHCFSGFGSTRKYESGNCEELVLYLMLSLETSPVLCQIFLTVKLYQSTCVWAASWFSFLNILLQVVRKSSEKLIPFRGRSVECVHSQRRKLQLLFSWLLQSNLSMADMPYSGHFVIVHTFSWNRTNQGQTLRKTPI